ncbi:hypothetical protein [Rhizobacter sp. P5_C2]
MADVDAVTLRIAIEAVDAQITKLSAELEAPGADADGSIEIDLLQHTKAAHKLEVAYKAATKNSSNMPPYDSLVKI